MLHDSNEEFGEVTLGRLRQFEWCDVQATYRLEVSFSSPLNHRLFSADLIGIGGRVNRGFGSWPGRGYYTRDGFVTGFWQDFAASPGFEPTAFQVTVNREEYRVEIEAPAVPTPHDDVNHIEQRARIAVRIDSESNEVVACLRVVGSELSCPTDEQMPLNFQTTGWQRLNLLSWSIPLAVEDVPQMPHCSPTVELGEQAWQMTALGGDGSAVYVGRNQFITADRLFEEETPWGVVSQGMHALPVARVASDARNGLALVEVIGAEQAGLHRGSIVRFASSTDQADMTAPFLVAYPWGDADRFAMTRLRISHVTDRLLEHDGWGWDRAGAPIVDPCTHEVIALSTGRSEALRAETAVTVLERLRRERVPVQLPTGGPELHGSVALLSHPVYLSTEQPDFGGWICNVRDSIRYDVIYAVYMVSIASPDVTSVVDGVRARAGRCGWSGKIFIVEYRANEEPTALCAEPWSPRSPRSNTDLSLSLSPGIELVQASDFVRAPCPALPKDPNWPSTHMVKLRFSELLDIRDISVRIEDADGKLHASNYETSDVDPDVWTWRFNLGDAEPARLIASQPGESSDFDPPSTTDDDEGPDGRCVEDDGREGHGLITETLIRKRIAIGSVRVVEFGAPVQCPWFHTHGVIVEFAPSVPQSTRLDASLIGADGRVIDAHTSGSAYYHGHEPDTYSVYRPVFIAPDGFEPVAVEIVVGGRRWIALDR